MMSGTLILGESKMEELLKNLLENEVLSDETKGEVREAFSKALEEARAEQEKAVRAELAERYEKDKKDIHRALEQFIESELKDHVAEFRTGVNEVQDMKAKYAGMMSSVKEQARKYVNKRVGAVEQVIEGILRKELTELHESEKTNRRAYLQAITEKKAEMDGDYNKFRSKAAAVLENIINVQVQSTLEEMRDDIVAARKADFGREIYESFMNTFRRQFFDSSKEFSRVTSELREARKELAESRKETAKKLKEARELAKAERTKRAKLEESVTRAKSINKMLSGLNGSSREKMRHLLEATKTSDLNKTYRKYLPEVLNESRSSSSPDRSKRANKRKLNEAALELRTGGNRTVKESSSSEDDDEIVEIRRLAGTNNKK